MSKYRELINGKNRFLDYLIDKYNENPKEGKRSFILNYLRITTLFYDETSIEKEHYHTVYTYLSDVYIYSNDVEFFEELTVDKLVKKAKNETDYIKIINSYGNAFIFNIKEYCEQGFYDINSYNLGLDPWIDHKDKYYFLPDYIADDITNNSIRIAADDTYQETEYKHIKLDIKPGQLTIIGGRPAMGKTRLASNILLNEIENGGRVLYLTLDDTALNVGRKILGIRSDIPSRNILQNSFTDKQHKRALKYLDGLNNIVIYECNYFNIEEIENVINNSPIKPTMIIVDELDTIHYHENFPKTIGEKIEIASRLNAVALKNNASVIAIANVLRSVEKRKDKRPKYIKDLKYGQALEETADKIYTIYRDDYYLESDDEDKYMPMANMEIYDVKDNKTILCEFHRSSGVIEEIKEPIKWVSHRVE